MKYNYTKTLMILKTLGTHKAIQKLFQGYQITGTRQLWSEIKIPNDIKCTSNARSEAAIAYSKKAATFAITSGNTLGRGLSAALGARRLSLRVEISAVT